ncbi:helix-turn-helix transcriptional regulator [Acidovorax sp. SUPP2539]|uniref:helix-turn-helix domain-containing protein n=1 Tax=Acidovorax sp. SUPP2539 TaxID=2920878 RepID=UPI0032E9DA93
MAKRLQVSDFSAGHFGEALFELRQRQCLSQRQLAELVQISPSLLSEIENTRRPPPPVAKVRAIGRALKLTEAEQRCLIAYAERERVRLGLRVTKNTPQHVADLLREIAGLARELSPDQVLMIKKNLMEEIMK